MKTRVKQWRGEQWWRAGTESERGGGHGFPSNQSKVSTFSERVTPYSSSGSRTSTSVLSDTEEEEVQPSSNFVGTCPYMCPGKHIIITISNVWIWNQFHNFMLAELQCWILYDGMSLLVRLVKNERVGLLPIGVGSGRRG